MATWQRSLELLQAFRLEQTDPAVFYRRLAADSVAQIECFIPLDGAWVLDVGGGPGYWSAAFRGRGARYTPLDADAGELALHGRVPEPGTVLGDGQALPFQDGGFDVVYSSNVGEHVPDPWRMGDEMVRVCRPGGLVFYSYTLWYGPWGGHETSPWHLLGGDLAARRYQRRHRRRPKNRYGQSMFPVTAAAGLAWARSVPQVELVTAMPRYLPWTVRDVVRVPLLRELAVWNLALVLRKR